MLPLLAASEIGRWYFVLTKKMRGKKELVLEEKEEKKS
jgi:hypothetical protein